MHLHSYDLRAINSPINAELGELQKYKLLYAPKPPVAKGEASRVTSAGSIWSDTAP